jgi:steroid delta-isomerase-like uncharacterized protein
MSAMSNRELIRKFYQEVWNEGKVHLADKYLSPSHAFVDPNALDEKTGPAAYKEIVMRFFEAFSGLKFEVQDMVCEKDKVVAAWTISGVHTGEYRGIAATNKKISFDGISIHQIADEKIMDTSSVWDTLGLMKKIGAIVTVSRARAKARGN